MAVSVNSLLYLHTAGDYTRDQEGGLLLVLSHPEIPLHNNPAELGARTRVRKRDVSFGPRAPEGSKAWDTFMSLAATARKLDISFYDYVHDRISQTNMGSRSWMP